MILFPHVSRFLARRPLRTLFRRCGLLLTLLLAICSAAGAAERKPNVLLIVADDLGWSDLGCYGSRYHQTPNLDQMAAEGIRLTQAYAACPVCSPTRASLMTGKYPARLGITDWLPGRPDRSDQKLLRPELVMQLPLAETTLAEVFRSAGYTTGHIGKWHLGGKGFGPTDQGFDVNIAGDETGTPLSYMAPFQRDGRVMPGLVESQAGEYLTDRLAAEAEKFIAANRDRPFFLYLPHYAPHTPLTARPDLQKKWDEREWPQSPGAQSNPTYAAMLESLDAAVGRVRRSLEAAGIADETIVVFTSDNGGLATSEGPKTPSTFNSPLREGKGFLYEGGIRVPLIVTWPTHLGAGKTRGSPVSSIDLPVTLTELCGIPWPGTTDGTSLAGLLRDDTELPERALYWHYPHYSNQRSRPGGAVRKGNWKLIEFYENGRRELFDVGQDLSESRNLSEQFPEKVQELGAALASWRTAVNARMMTSNPGYVPNPQQEDGRIILPAKTAEVHGVMLRYEPLPHKETLGFWVRESDWAHWDFTVKTPGRFLVEILQGCGPGSGGSSVEFALGDQVLTTTVEETKGFQDFRRRQIGEVLVEAPGRFTLTVKPRQKPGVAVMDLREVVLVPVSNK